MDIVSIRTVFFIFLASSILTVFSQPLSRIRLNQSGFYPGAAKLAIITGPFTSEFFYILTAERHDTVFTGKPGLEMQSAYSDITTRRADFTTFRKTGLYIIDVPGTGVSFPFRIENQVHHAIALQSLKAFYFQRAGMPIEKKFAGKWSRPEGHPDRIVLIHPSAASDTRAAGSVISTPGGWYDAGDYNKYIVNSGITMGTLFSAYEDFPEYFKMLKTNIPESSNKIPDILDEALYNLRWMLSMQDPEDGGVYHKCTNKAFDAMIMPDKAVQPRYVVQKSTAAALDFAAVTAQAFRIFQKFKVSLPHLADSCLAASLLAWSWAQEHPEEFYSQKAINSKFQPPITTGEYGDNHLNDEWLWAAAELYLTTKKNSFLEILKDRLNDEPELPSWSNVGMLGYYSFLRNTANLNMIEKPVADSLKEKLIKMADNYLSGNSINAYGTVMGHTKKDFTWGSNAVAANQGVLLINAFLITGKKMYLDGALTNLDYIMGRNATGYCFVTGFGSHSPMHPHHRLSVADGIEDPVPGLMVGGPNPGRQDKCSYPFTDPENSYVDSDCAYACNEIAINWNAPLVYLAAAMEKLELKL